MLDLFNNQVVSVDIDRDHGFLEGMGIDPGSKTQNGKEAKTGNYTGGKGGDYQIACHQPTQGAIAGGQTAMENCLSSNGDINVVYTINEPAADGALQGAQGGWQEATSSRVDRRRLPDVKARQERDDRARRGAVPGQDGQLGRPRDRDLATGGKKPTVSDGLGLLQHRHRARHDKPVERRRPSQTPERQRRSAGAELTPAPIGRPRRSCPPPCDRPVAAGPASADACRSTELQPATTRHRP